MLGTYSYHEIFRKTVVAFGTLFNNIEIQRTNEVFKVPLAYGPKQKFLARLDQTPDPTNKRVQMTLPRISFEINGITYDSSRKVSPTQKIKIAKDNDENKNVFMPVPYNLNFQLAIISKTQEDGLEILEQILPYFQPHYNLPVRLLPEANETKDVPVILNSVDYEDDYENNFQTRRAIIYSFNFVVKGYIFGPVSNKGVIKRTVVDFNVAEGDTLVDVSKGPNKRLTLTPGVLANGSPTTNSTASVAATSITANSTYGFAFDSEDFFDGKLR